MPLTDDDVREVLRRDLRLTGWEVSDPLGSTGTTRLAHRGTFAVAVKLVDRPVEIMTRLSDLGVTPPVLAAGELEGHRYLVQQRVSGPHPDHDWFRAHVGPWAELVRSYLEDLPLLRMLEASPAFWRLDVAGALAMFEEPPAVRFGALEREDFRDSLWRWQQQSGSIIRLPMSPAHPDPHGRNYVIADGRAYLLDWEHVDLSDPIRDVGFQAWSFLRRDQWSEFLHRVGLGPIDDHLEAGIYWWAAMKMLMTAFWCDSRADEAGTAFHARLFRIAVDRQPWVDRRRGQA